MKIKIINHIQNELNHIIEIRVEQELKPFNSLNKFVEIPKLKTEGLSDDEICTMAYKQIKNLAIGVFKKVEYVEESENCEGFKIIESKPFKIEILGNKTLTKLKNFEVKEMYKACVINQYGELHKETNVELVENYVGITIENNEVAINDFEGVIKLKASYYSLETSIELNVNQITQTVSEQEKAIDLIKYLMENTEFLKAIGIEPRDAAE